MSFQVPQAIASKYMAKQPAGFCQFLAQIVPGVDVNACMTAQARYLESVNALGKWAQGLSTYYKAITGFTR